VKAPVQLSIDFELGPATQAETTHDLEPAARPGVHRIGPAKAAPAPPPVPASAPIPLPEPVEEVHPVHVEVVHEVGPTDVLVAPPVTVPAATVTPRTAPAPLVEDEPILEDEPPPAAPVTETAKPKPRKKKRKLLKELQEKLDKQTRRFEIIRRGLAFFYWGTYTMLGAAGVFILGWIAIIVVVLGNRDANAEFDLQKIGEGWGVLISGITTAWTFLWVVFGIFYLLGSIGCCWVPAESRLRLLIYPISFLNTLSLVLVLGAIGLRLSGLVYAERFDMKPAGFDIVFVLALTLPFLPGFVLLFFFLRALAIYLDDEGSVQETLPILGVLTLLTIFAPGIFAGLLVFAIFFGLLGDVVFIAGIATWGFFWGKQWVRLINLTGSLQQSLENFRDLQEKSLFLEQAAR
jgi:hypothetical protein